MNPHKFSVRFFKNIFLYKKPSAIAIISIWLMASFVSKAETLIRIEIPESGIYDISYDQLKDMGFSDPSRVGVFGRGAEMLPVSNDITDKFSFPLVPVIQREGGIRFYAQGPDNISFDENIPSEKGGAFVNKGRNIFTDYGIYFLYDADGIKKEMEKTSAATATVDMINSGLSYAYHELESTQNSTGTGNIFWGEKFDIRHDKIKKWTVSLPSALEEDAYFQFQFFGDQNVNYSLYFGNETTNKRVFFENISQYSKNLIPFSGTEGKIGVKKGKNEIYIDLQAVDNEKAKGYLDYWILTYTTDCEEAKNGQINPVAFPQIKNNKTAAIQFSSSEIDGIDITVPSSPKLLYNEKTGTQNKIQVSNSGEIPTVIFFNTSQNQKKISAWHKIDDSILNKELLGAPFTDAELLIITPADLKESADEIAELHKQTDGAVVATVTIDEVYFKFSCGIPDPEAYRRMMAYLYENGNLKNLLLLGSISGNIRNQTEQKGYAGVHIIPQATTISREWGAYPLMDYYGIASENLKIDKLQQQKINVGLGNLPFRNKKEADLYIKKLTHYLTEYNHSLALNDWLLMGGTGDNHTHDAQCNDLQEYIDNISGKGVIGSVLALDAYDYREAKQRFNDYLADGKGYMVYIGHSANHMLEKNNRFFTTADISSLSNSILPLILFAGCNASGTDFGARGLAEELVIGSMGGAIGSIAALRETWSKQNFDFAKELTSIMISQNFKGSEKTIGQIMADAKSNIMHSNNLPYILICDPALKVPLPKTNMVIDKVTDLVPGEKIIVKGKVLSANGEINKDFNGDVTVKLALPVRELLSDDFVSNTNMTESSISIRYNDRIAAIALGNVTEGTFNVELQLPPDLERYANEECIIYAACHDPMTYSGCAASSSGLVTAAVNNTQNKDDVGPSIKEFYYDPGASSIYLRAYDESGLQLLKNSGNGNSRIRLDGNINRSISLVPIDIFEQGKEILFSAFVPNLPAGPHSITAELSDIYGNMSTATLDMIGGKENQSFDLVLKERVVSEKATFEISDNEFPVGSTDIQIVILKNNGDIVRKIDLKGGAASWDKKDSAGNAVYQGLYKAYAIEKGNNGTIKRQSKTIRVPVI